MVASSSGTIVLAYLTDAANNRWSISPQAAVLKNGFMAGFTANVAELAYVGGVVWHANIFRQWYSWNGAGWVAGNDPTAGISQGGTATLAAIQVVIGAAVTTITQEIAKMSGDLGSQMTAGLEKLSADQQEETSAIAALTTATNTLIAAFKGASVGSPVTQAMVNAVAAADAAVQANTAAATADTTEETAAMPGASPTTTA
jgi:hypothetical protein